MSIPVGLTIPKLLPITGTFALPISAYYIWLQTRVVLNRVDSETYIGNSSSDPSTSASSEDDRLSASIRAQVNFSENVPLALALAAVAELNGADRKFLTGALSALLVFRVLHAEFGLMQAKNMGKGRPLGYFGTQSIVAVLSGYTAYLVKGYWGF